MKQHYYFWVQYLRSLIKTQFVGTVLYRYLQYMKTFFLLYCPRVMTVIKPLKSLSIKPELSEIEFYRSLTSSSLFLAQACNQSLFSSIQNTHVFTYQILRRTTTTHLPVLTNENINRIRTVSTFTCN